ncbi:TolC family protein [Chromatiaceae bacterium AAb-1]|nr:TolC family protein [Chromatiaceae bacterium AAb-1]
MLTKNNKDVNNPESGLLSSLLGIFFCVTVHAEQHTTIRLSELQNRLTEPAAMVADRELRASLTTGIWHVEQAVRQAVQWHPSIAEAVGLLLQQYERITVAKAGYYPRVTAGFKAGYDSHYQGDAFSQAFVLSVSQMLYDFGKVSGAVREAEAGVVQQQAVVLQAIDQLLWDASQAVVEIQRYQNMVKIAGQQLTGLNRVAALARERNTKGASSLSDVVQSDSRIEGARAVYLQHLSQLERWRGTLAILLGEEQLGNVSEQFPDQLNACSVAQFERYVIPAVLIAQAQRSKAVAQLAQAEVQLLPTISLDPSATHYFNDNQFTGNNGNNRERTQYAVALNFSVPFDQGGSVKAQQRAAAQALQTADFAVQHAQLTARQKLLESQNQMLNLQQNLDILVRRQQLSAETRDLYRQQYLELGTRPLLDLLNAEQEIHQALMDYQHTVSDLRQLQLSCFYHSGILRRVFALENTTIQGIELYP